MYKMGTFKKICFKILCFRFMFRFKKINWKKNYNKKQRWKKIKPILIRRYSPKRSFRVNRITCELYADPHVKGFNKKYFNAQTVGDWILYKGKNLSAHYRGKSFGSWVGAVKFGVRLYKYKIYSTGFNFETVKVNGRLKKLLNGVNKLKHGGFIKKEGNKITFSTNDGEEVDFISYGSFFNAYVRSNIPKITGICSEKFIHSHFFSHYHKGHRVKFSKKHCVHKKRHVLSCKRRGLKGAALKNCVFDRCAGLSKKNWKKNVKKK